MHQGSAANLSEMQPTHVARLLSIMQNHPIFCYFLIAYVITWGGGFPYIVLWHHYDPPIWVIVLLALGPTISSFIMTAATEGKVGVGKLLRSYVRWRVSVIWYLLVMIGLPVLILLVCLTFPGGVAAVLHGLARYPLVYVLVFFLGGPFLEEPGWRGFALPRLQQSLSPLKGSLLLGVLWALWHLPLFFIPGYNGASSGFVGISTAMLAFLFATAAFSIILAWVFNNTRGSLLLTMLLHASINTSNVFTSPANTSLVYQILLYAVLVAIALLVIVITRGKLSYDRYRHEKGLDSWTPDRSAREV